MIGEDDLDLVAEHLAGILRGHARRFHGALAADVGVKRGHVGEDADFDRPFRGLRRNHPHGPSLDHITDLQYGGHPTARWNLRPAHFGCNAGKRREKAPVRRTSVDWPF